MTTTRDPLQLLDGLVEAIGAEQGRLVAHPDPKQAELAPTPELLDAIKAVRGRIAELADALDDAWGLIANVGTYSGRGWAGEGPEWQHAAIKWRDTRYLGSQANPRRPRELEIVMGGQADRLDESTPADVHLDAQGRALLAEGTATGELLADRDELARDLAYDGGSAGLEGDVGAELDGGPAHA